MAAANDRVTYRRVRLPSTWDTVEAFIINRGRQPTFATEEPYRSGAADLGEGNRRTLPKHNAMGM